MTDRKDLAAYVQSLFNTELARAKDAREENNYHRADMHLHAAAAYQSVMTRIVYSKVAQA